MPRLKPYVGEYYHIYNRGVDKRNIFMDENDYVRFLKSIDKFNYLGVQLPESGVGLRLVELICYCLNPNHFHLLMKQITDKGIEKFMHKLGTSYTNYFNLKYNRSGSLFEGKYKARHVQDNASLLWLSAYINGNPEIHQIAKANNYKWSSYPYYLDKRKKDICNQKEVLDQFEDVSEYQDFVKMVIQEVKFNRREIKGLG